VVICHPAGIAANYGLPSGAAPAIENPGCKNSGWVMRIVGGNITVSDLDSKMKKDNPFLSTTFALVIAAVLASGVTAHAFDLSEMLGNPGQDESLDTFKLIHVNDLAGAIADPKSGVIIYDANHPDTRAQYGIIPGAHLLPSADGFSVERELPADKNAKLVFYCANTH
jgi:hypothetical protein